MGLKQLIRDQKILRSGVVDQEFVMPEEPLPYSIKLSVGSRVHSLQYFRNRKWASFLKCYFRAYRKANIPVVLFVRFYVPPHDKVKITPRRLKSEQVPALGSFELCDYLLSFMEMLFGTLISSYRQIAKIDAEKYFSHRPRTVFKFMSWDHYVFLKNKNLLNTKGKSLSKDAKIRLVQPKRKGYERNTNAYSLSIT